MGFYPIAVELARRPCLVVGGGPVAERKVDGLLAVDADVTVVSPTITELLEGHLAAARIRHHARLYQRGDLRGVTLVFTALDDPDATRAIAAEAREHGVWVNAADETASCDFILPGIVRRGALTIAVVSGATSPAVTRALREHLDSVLGAEWTTLAALAAEARRDLHAARYPTTGETWRRALGPAVRALIVDGRVDDARHQLRAILGVPG
jgi:precorrin-2 dehydrogenase/sirohydrochlorin ferrochelatase